MGTISSRFTLDGADEVQSQLIALGAAGQAAMDKLKGATAPATEGLSAVGEAASKTKEAISGFGETASKVAAAFASSFGELGEPINKLLEVFNTASEGAGGFVERLAGYLSELRRLAPHSPHSPRRRLRRWSRPTAWRSASAPPKTSWRNSNTH
jgi:hypothetical protein